MLSDDGHDDASPAISQDVAAHHFCGTYGSVASVSQNNVVHSENMTTNFFYTILVNEYWNKNSRVEFPTISQLRANGGRDLVKNATILSRRQRQGA
jgi:hypothetical protein